MLDYLSNIEKNTQVEINRINIAPRESSIKTSCGYIIATLDLNICIEKPEEVPYQIWGTTYLSFLSNDLTSLDLYTYIVLRSHYNYKESEVIYLEEVRNEFYIWSCLYTHLLKKKILQERKKSIKEFFFSNESMDSLKLIIMEDGCKIHNEEGVVELV